MNYSFCQTPQIDQDQCIIFGVFSDHGACERLKALDEQSKGLLSQLLEQKVLGERPADTYLVNHSEAIAPSKLLLVNCGKKDAFDGKAYIKVVKKALAEAGKTKSKNLCLVLTGAPITDKDSNWAVSQAAQCIEYQQYRFDNFKNEKSTDPTFEEVLFCHEDTTEHQQALTQGLAIGHGVNFARDLGNLPGNVCTPSYLAEQAQALAKTYDCINSKIIDESEMHDMGMGAFLSVAKGSEQRGKLIEMHYQGADKNEKPIALVGKGITFDAGGISLKPAANMDEMKYDMCGAASVFGTLKAIAEMKLNINVVALVAAAENLPSGVASKPGDIVTSMSGQTIEILNTDAEGRLVLCDTLTYAERFEPRTVIDIATLTGAMVIALGHETTGFMSNDDSLADDLMQASGQIEDKAWRMPMTEDYQQYLESNFADMANVGSSRAAGSITAACFLSRFTKKFRWAHVDNAGSAWVSGKAKGATGRPVPMLSQLLINYAND